MGKYHLNNSKSLPVGFTLDKLRLRFNHNRFGYSSWVSTQINLINDVTRRFRQNTFTCETHIRFLAFNVHLASALLARILRYPLISLLPLIPGFLFAKKIILDFLINLQLARSLIAYVYMCVCLDIYFSNTAIQSTSYLFNLDHTFSLSKIPPNVYVNSLQFSSSSYKSFTFLDIRHKGFANGLIVTVETIKSFLNLIIFRKYGKPGCSILLFNYKRFALYILSNAHMIFLESLLRHKCELVVVSTTNSITTPSYFLNSSITSIKSLYFQVSNNLSTDFGVALTSLHLYTMYIPLFDRFFLRRGFLSDLINTLPSSSPLNIEYACNPKACISRNNYTSNKKRILCITSIPKRQYCYSLGIHPDPLNDIAIIDKFFRDIHSAVSVETSLYVKPKRSSFCCDIDYPKYIKSFFPSVKIIDSSISVESLVNDYCFDAIIALPWSSFLYETKLVDPDVNVVFYDPIGVLSQPPDNKYSNISCINSYSGLLEYYNSL